MLGKTRTLVALLSVQFAVIRIPDETTLVKSAKKIISGIEHRISHVYQRPLMYGGSAEGVDLCLHTYHSLWAESLERLKEFDDVLTKRFQQENCGAMGFANRALQLHPDATVQFATEYVTTQWKNVSKQLGIPLESPL